MPDKVKCADCGYLGIRLLANRQLVDADEVFRKTGGLVQATTMPMLDETPVCFAKVADFYTDMGPHPDSGRRLNHITKDRDCLRHIDWHPGFSPKEHYEMELMKEQREHNRLMPEAEHQARQQQADAERSWREADRSHREKEAEKSRAALPMDDRRGYRNIRISQSSGLANSGLVLSCCLP